MAITISLCMIVRNEEAVLGRCLDSVGDIADEIILVDTGSSDRTVEIARAYTPHVYFYPWHDDFASARNFSFSKATMDYCMWLDADDVLLPDDRRKLSKIKEALSSEVDVVMLPYCLSRDENANPVFQFYRERIVRNTPAFRWHGQVHETIPPSGKVVRLDATVTHQKMHVSDPDRNLRILEKIKNSPSGLSPRQLYYYGRELKEHGRCLDAIKALEQFLTEPEGWVVNKMEACLVLADCYTAEGRQEDAMATLLKGFLLPIPPRAELCCALGHLFLEDTKYEHAIFWYQAALSLPYRPEADGFVEADCYGFLPCIWLCVCYDRLGDRERAEYYNERAGSYKSESPAYLYNRQYFAKLRAKAKKTGKETTIDEI